MKTAALMLGRLECQGLLLPAGDLAEIVHAPTDAAPISGEDSKVQDRMGCIVVPEASMLADDLIRCVAGSQS